ncbi:hypothetical protein C8R43DRAFT_1053448, partial [Mycena crocata]
MPVRDYVCRVQKALELHLLEAHGIQQRHLTTPASACKSATIATHGFAMNITREPLPWFDQVVACGLADVKAGSVETVLGEGRDFMPMHLADEGE